MLEKFESISGEVEMAGPAGPAPEQVLKLDSNGARSSSLGQGSSFVQG